MRITTIKHNHHQNRYYNIYVRVYMRARGNPFQFQRNFFLTGEGRDFESLHHHIKKKKYSSLVNQFYNCDHVMLKNIVIKSISHLKHNIYLKYKNKIIACLFRKWNLLDIFTALVITGEQRLTQQSSFWTHS